MTAPHAREIQNLDRLVKMLARLLICVKPNAGDRRPRCVGPAPRLGSAPRSSLRVLPAKRGLERERCGAPRSISSAQDFPDFRRRCISARRLRLEIVVHERGAQAGGRRRSFYDEALGMTIDSGNYFLLPSWRSTLATLDLIGARGQWREEPNADLAFADMATGERWTLRPNAGKNPVVDARRRGVGRRARSRGTIWPSASCEARPPAPSSRISRRAARAPIGFGARLRWRR